MVPPGCKGDESAPLGADREEERGLKIIPAIMTISRWELYRHLGPEKQWENRNLAPVLNPVLGTKKAVPKPLFTA